MPLSFNAVISRLAASAAPPVFSLVLTINTRISWFVWDRKVNEWATALSDNADGQVDIALRSDVGCTRFPLLGARHKRTVVEHLPYAIALVSRELVASIHGIVHEVGGYKHLVGATETFQQVGELTLLFAVCVEVVGNVSIVFVFVVRRRVAAIVGVFATIGRAAVFRLGKGVMQS